MADPHRHNDSSQEDYSSFRSTSSGGSWRWGVGTALTVLAMLILYSNQALAPRDAHTESNSQAINLLSQRLSIVETLRNGDAQQNQELKDVIKNLVSKLDSLSSAVQGLQYTIQQQPSSAHKGKVPVFGPQ